MLEGNRTPVTVDGRLPDATRAWCRRGGEVALALVALVGGWQVAVVATAVPTVVLPSPAAVLEAGVADAGPLLAAVVHTGREAVLGWLVGVAAGLALAVGMALSARLRRLVYPLVLAVRIVPLVVFAPVLVVVLGPTLPTRVLLAALLSFFPVAVATLDGLRSVPESQVALLQSVGASRWQRLRHVRLPNAVPAAVVGLQIATPLALEGVVIAEFLVASGGLGAGILDAGSRLATPLLFAYLLALVGLGLGLFAVVAGLGRVLVPGGEADPVAPEAFWLDGGQPTDDRLVAASTAALSLGGVVVAWAVAARAVPHGGLFLAGPDAVARLLVDSPWVFVGAATASAAKLGGGLALGGALGIAVGAVAALVPPLRTGAYTYLVGFRVLPVIAFAPLLLVWLGVSFAAGVVLVAAATVFPVAIAAAVGLRRLPADQRDLLRVVDAAGWRRALVRLRYAVPTLLAGVKLAVVTGLSGTVVAEWFVASDGLGVLVLQQTRSFQPALTFAAIAVLFALGASLFGLVSLVQRRLMW
jgi:ABC-type nitrate/sulfonate/bicarbonate transport system permease component